MGQHNENPLEELRYWETKSVDEPVKEIQVLYDFEQAPCVLIALEEKALERAVRMGVDIIKYDRDDQFLQASVLQIFFTKTSRRSFRRLKNARRLLNGI
jgi:hypothetical protein